VSEGKKFYGKYRGTVVNNIDPLQIGRIQVIVPDVSNVVPTSWAMPCVPIAGKQSGVFVIPQLGAGVWVEFEQGDPDYPIWAGCWWGAPTDVPTETLPLQTQKVVLKTAGGQSIVLDDTPAVGGIFLKTSFGTKVSIGALIIEIDDGKGGKIKMEGPKVTINNGALEVLF